MNFSTLLSGEVLAGHLNDPNLRIFDCRHQLSDVEFGARAYADGHLPGAFFLHLDRDLSAPMNGRNGRHPLPDAQLLASKLGAAGVSRKTQVVAYDDDGGMIAARLWWLLRWLGHDRVALLDGGIRQWVKEGRALTHEQPEQVPAHFEVDEVERRDWVVSSDEVLASLGRHELCLVDARAPDRFRGENETLDPVAGHIPGARNRFFRDNLDAEGCFRPASELRREFLALLAGVDPAQSVMQCGSGVTACHNLLAMEIAGLHGARLYAGSWSEWCADPDRPVAR
jgi:thiosulfate/3-mercaptopyruvate sulfurtransferase